MNAPSLRHGTDFLGRRSFPVRLHCGVKDTARARGLRDTDELQALPVVQRLTEPIGPAAALVQR